MSQLKKTALNEAHRKLGGRMIDFGGWDMPVQYAAGTVEEHLAVRAAAGIFDVSHMGEIEVRGPQSLDLIQHLTTNDASKLSDGQAQYSGLTYPEGTLLTTSWFIASRRIIFSSASTLQTPTKILTGFAATPPASTPK